MSRIGIDLGATQCRLIDVRATPKRSPTRVLSFDTIPHGWSDPPALARALGRRLAGRRGGVAVWGLASAHQLLHLPPAADRAELARLARQEAARDIGPFPDAEVVSGAYAPASESGDLGAGMREVAFVAASIADIRRKVQPLIDAGFSLESVLTPALALASLARLRRHAIPGTAVALLSIGAATTALAIVRDGVLLLAREIPWGHRRPDVRPADPEPLFERLASELQRSLTFLGRFTRCRVAQVALCGEAPELRSLTAPLGDRLGIDVEILDSLDGIASDALPEPAGAFRAQVVKYRLAWAAGVDERPPINLVPPDLLARRRSPGRAAALSAGVAAALLIGVVGYRSADRAARLDERRLRALEVQIAALASQVQTVERARPAEEPALVRRARSDAAAAQGPRLARVLERIGAAPREVRLRRFAVTASGGGWTAAMSGTAIAADPARAQAVVAGLLKDVASLSGVSSPAGPSAMRLLSGGASSVPPGMVGLEFEVSMEIRR